MKLIILRIRRFFRNNFFVFHASGVMSTASISTYQCINSKLNYNKAKRTSHVSSEIVLCDLHRFKS